MAHKAFLFNFNVGRADIEARVTYFKIQGGITAVPVHLEEPRLAIICFDNGQTIDLLNPIG